MHMTISMVVPLLLVLGAPITLALRALSPRRDKTWGPREVVLQVVHSRVLRVLANPVVAAALFFGSLVVFYYSPLFELALRTHTGHVLMVLHFLLTGYLFAWVLIGIDPGPPKWSPSMRLLILFATISLPRVLRGRPDRQHDRCWRPTSSSSSSCRGCPTRSSTSTTAGAIAWGIGEAPTLILALRGRRRPGSAPTSARPGARTARPTATATPS